MECVTILKILCIVDILASKAYKEPGKTTLKPWPNIISIFISTKRKEKKLCVNTPLQQTICG